MFEDDFLALLEMMQYGKMVMSALKGLCSVLVLRSSLAFKSFNPNSESDPIYLCLTVRSCFPETSPVSTHSRTRSTAR